MQGQEDHRRDHRVGHLVHRKGTELAAFDPSRDDAAEQPVRRLDHLGGVERRDLGEVAHLGHDDLVDAAGIGGADALPPGVGDVAQQFGCRARVGGKGLDALGDQRAQVVPDDRLEQLFLAWVVQVQRALGHAGAGRDLVGARGSKPFFDEQYQGRIEQFLRPRLFAALACGGRRGGRDGVHKMF
jgi:hypothetical protein